MEIHLCGPGGRGGGTRVAVEPLPGRFQVPFRVKSDEWAGVAARPPAVLAGRRVADGAENLERRIGWILLSASQAAHRLSGSGGRLQGITHDSFALRGFAARLFRRRLAV